MDLTKRQQEIFDFIKRYSAANGYPPTVRDIGKAVGLASSSTVHAHLANLERIGLLRRDPTKPRAIELLDRAAAGMRGFVKPGLPLVGQVAAGQPIARGGEHRGVHPDAGGRRRSRRRVPAAGARRLDDQRRASSRTIWSWCARRRPREDGEIIVALVGDEATVKRFFQEPDHVRLQPENATMEPIRSKEVRVLGRVVGLMRSF